MKIEQDDMMYKKSKDTSKKTLTIILVLITITVFIVIGIVALMASMKEEKLSVNIDGKVVTVADDIFIFAEGTGEIYVSIKDITSLVGYEWHNGEYKVNSEDTSKMYVEAKDGTETTSFYLNSKVISKVAPDSKEDYENIEINAPVTMINDKWYISAEGFTKAFNSAFSYNQANKKITIQTLPYLVAYYTQNIQNYGYDTLSEEFNNQKALAYGMIVASKTSNKRFGVINIKTGNEIISPRYNNIKFIESSCEFIITNASGKVGIAYSTGDTKINVLYDEIKVFDSSLGYYLVKSNSKYGVINSNEEVVIHIEYDKIGIDTASFPADNLKSQYVLYDKLIPVSLNKKWGLFDIEGKKVSEVEYDSIGCINKDVKDRTLNNTITIGDTEVIVIGKDKLYGLMTTRGDMLGNIMFEYVFSVISGGNTNYWLFYNGLDYNALNYIKLYKERLGYNDDENDNNENNNNGENTEPPAEGEEQKPEENVEGSDTNNEEQNPDNNESNEQNNEDNQTGEENNQLTDVQAYNLRFEPYAGEHSKGSIRSLLDTIQTSNLTHENKVQVEFNGNTYDDNVNALKEQIVNNVYNVTIEYNEETKYIKKIIIS